MRAYQHQGVMRPRSGCNRSSPYSYWLPFSSFVVSPRLMADYNQHTRLLSFRVLVSVRCQVYSASGRSRRCYLINFTQNAGGFLSAMAFHEKAGRRGNSGSKRVLRSFFCDRVSSPTEPPLSPCFHPHSRGRNRFARRMWAFSIQPVLLSDLRPLVHPNPNVGHWRSHQNSALSFLFLERF